MAGIKVGSSTKLTSPIPHLANATFANEAARLTSGQLRHTSWDYHQLSDSTYWRIKPLSSCVLADGTTPATQAGTWGTLPEHWTEAGAGGAKFKQDVPVVLAGGKTLGPYKNGDTIPAAGKTLDQFAALLAQEELFPTYTPPGADLSSAINGTVEVGTLLTPTLTPIFARNDAGALTAFSLKRNNTTLSTALPLTPTSDSYTIGTAPVTYVAQFTYAAGAIKQGSLGTPAPGAIGAGSLTRSLTIASLYKGYYGLVDSPADLTVPAIVALGNGVLQSGVGRTITGVTAPGNKYFCYAWPSSGSDNVTGIILDGAAPVRGAFGTVRYVTGPNALGAAVTMGYIISNAPGAFTNNSLAFS